MKASIRSEKVEDYCQIAEICALAFFRDRFVGEMGIVDSLRHAPRFDPNLALVAELGGKVAGYALFNPYQVLVGGESVRAVALAPIAVEPQFQKKGIGEQLLAEGHRRAAELGYGFSFLVGHPEYYPRFGYIQRVAGTCKVLIGREKIAEMPQTPPLLERQVTRPDVPTLHEIWNLWFQDVDLAIQPELCLVDWISHAADVCTSVFEHEGEIWGFLRYFRSAPNHLRLFLARDHQAAAALLRAYSDKLGQGEQVSLPLHPRSKAVQEWLPPFASELRGEDWAMVKVLDPKCKPIVEYCAAVASGQRPPGILIWPSYYDNEIEMVGG